MLDINKIIEDKFGAFKRKRPFFSRFIVIPLVRYCFCEKKFNSAKDIALAKLKGIEFVNETLKYFNFKLLIDDKEVENIPKTGRFIIISNHPIGSLDGLALLSTIHKIRPDVRIIANDWLAIIPNIKELLLLVNNIDGNTLREHIQDIYKHLKKDKPLIIFPAGEVSRWSLKGIRDNEWNFGFLRFARATKSPILPIHLKARNSLWFYFLSLVHNKLSSLWLVREMMKQKNKKIKVTIGEIIPFSSYDSTQTSPKVTAGLMKKHLYRVGSKWLNNIFKTESCIITAQERKTLEKELAQALVLNESDSQITYDYINSTPQASPLMQELGRVREIAFRTVGEGTGNSHDLDKYDSLYHQLILWDKKEKVIVGSYRIGHGGKLMILRGGIKNFYSNNFYKFSPEIEALLEQGAELGRSFIMPKYWRKGGLKSLFLGIDSWLKKHPDRRYLFGTISISNNYPTFAKDMLVYFYLFHFGAKKPQWVTAKLIPYYPSTDNIELFSELFTGKYKTDLAILKEQLNTLGFSIPTLFRQYSELCYQDGIQFYSFNIDESFNYSLDCFIIVDLQRFNIEKAKHYFPYTCSKIKK